MSTFATERPAAVRAIRFTGQEMTVHLEDGRKVSMPLEWYPRLLAGTPQQRERAQLIGEGEGIHWPELDEHISLESILAGRRSAESESSFRRWLERRTAG